MLFPGGTDGGAMREVSVMAKDYFAPYGTYSFGSSLSPEELEKRLESACDEWLPLWSRDYRKFFFLRWGSRIILTPCCFLRNTLRARLLLTVEPAAAGGGSHIQVIAAPLNMRWFEWFCYGFCILVLAVGIYFRQWGTVFVPVMVPLIRGVLAICRQCAEEEVPRILRGFQMLLNRLEG